MTRASALCFVCVVVPLAFACNGTAHLEPVASKPKSKAVAASSVRAPSGPSDEVEEMPPDVDKATRWAWSAVGCFVGGAWSEALGALGEERTLATLRRCRTVATEILGAKLDDAGALSSVREIEPSVVDRVTRKIEQAGGASLAPVVRAAADASREALHARRAAERIRKGEELASSESTLGAKEALAKLWPRKEASAKTIALVLAADHVETARGLEGKAKTIAAAPAFEVVFGVPRRDDWADYLLAVAKAGGHPAEKNDETSALAGVAASFVDRFQQQGKANDPGEPKEVSWGCARRLRTELQESKKKK